MTSPIEGRGQQPELTVAPSHGAAVALLEHQDQVPQRSTTVEVYQGQPQQPGNEVGTRRRNAVTERALYGEIVLRSQSQDLELAGDPPTRTDGRGFNGAAPLPGEITYDPSAIEGKRPKGTVYTSEFSKGKEIKLFDPADPTPLASSGELTDPIDPGDKAPQPDFDEMRNAITAEGTISPDLTKKFKTAQERYTRIAARRDAASALTLNGSDRKKKGNTEKLMETARAELLAARKEMRDAYAAVLTGHEFDPADIEIFLAGNDKLFAVETSKMITDKEVTAFERKFKEGSPQRWLVEKWKSWDTTRHDGEKRFSARRVKNFFKKLGVSAAVGAGVAYLAGIVLPSVAAAAIAGGAAASLRTKATHLATRVDNANDRHAELEYRFNTDAELLAAPDYNDAALGEISADVNQRVHDERRKQVVGTALGALAGAVLAGSEIGLHHAFSGGHHAPTHSTQTHPSNPPAGHSPNDPQTTAPQTHNTPPFPKPHNHATGHEKYLWGHDANEVGAANADKLAVHDLGLAHAQGYHINAWVGSGHTPVDAAHLPHLLAQNHGQMPNLWGVQSITGPDGHVYVGQHAIYTLLDKIDAGKN